MKTKLAVKASIIAVSAVLFFAGLIYFIVDNAKHEKGGYYTAQDTLKSYNRGYKVGAQNTREVIKCERTDYSVVSCQDK